jgi:hypothetical protein
MKSRHGSKKEECSYRGRKKNALEVLASVSRCDGGKRRGFLLWAAFTHRNKEAT